MAIGDFLTKHTLYRPNKVAAIIDDIPYTYKYINDRSNKLANFLVEKGIKKGDRISVILLNCIEFLEVYFAAAKVGAIFVPLNYRLTPPELEFQLNDCGSRLIVFHDEFNNVVESMIGRVPVEKDKFFVVGENVMSMSFAQAYEEAIKDFPTDEPRPEQPVDWEDAQAIMYTSGVTGNPKGALLSHRKTLFNAINAEFYFDITSADIYFSPLPLFHSGGLFVTATPTMFKGATFITYRKFDPKGVLKTIEKYRVTIFLALTTLLNFIVKNERLQDYDLSSVRASFGGGERTAPELFEHFAKNGFVLQSGFGQTENSIMLFLSKEDAIRKKGCLGVPTFFCDVRIFKEHGVEADPFEVGEICVKGPTVMMGYWNRPEDTARTIIDGWLHTGDLGYYDDEGYFWFVDRIKDMYRSGGENVYPAEIEKALVTHPKIQNCAIIGVPDDKWGETGKALIILRQGETLTKEEIYEYLQGKVARYKFPSHIQFVDSFPHTESGKVKKSDLKVLYGGFTLPSNVKMG